MEMTLEYEPKPLPWELHGKYRLRATTGGIRAVVYPSGTKKRGWVGELFVNRDNRMLSGLWEGCENAEEAKGKVELAAGLFVAALGLGEGRA